MAQAADQNTPMRDLGALLRYLTVELGYTKGVAVFMMNERYLDGQLELTKVEYVGVKPQGEVPIDSEFGHIELDRRGVRFVSRIKLWRKVIYRIAEGCDVRGIWARRLSAAQTAPDQPPEDEAGPDPAKTRAAERPSAGQSSQKPLTSKKWLQGEIERREKLGNIPDEITEFSRQLHSQMKDALRDGVVDRAIVPRTIETHLRVTWKIFSKKKRSQKS